MPDMSLTNAKIDTMTAFAGRSFATCMVKKSV